jgi:hypothetical protein
MIEEVIVDPIVVEQSSQAECPHVTHRVSLGSKMDEANPEFHNLALTSDEFDADMLYNEPSNEQNVDEDDETSSTDNEEVSNEALIGPGGEVNDLTVSRSLVHVCDVPTCSRLSHHTRNIRGKKKRRKKEREAGACLYANLGCL